MLDAVDAQKPNARAKDSSAPRRDYLDGGTRRALGLGPEGWILSLKLPPE